MLTLFDKLSYIVQLVFLELNKLFGLLIFIQDLFLKQLNLLVVSMNFLEILQHWVDYLMVANLQRFHKQSLFLDIMGI